MSQTKWCPDCHEYLDEVKFNRNRSKKDGRESYCKKHAYLRKKKSIFNKIIEESKSGR